MNLGRTADMTSISNMPILEEGVPVPGTDYVWDVYQESVKMSTYLVAFVVSDFTFRRSDPLDNGVEFRIWSRREAYNQTEYASKVGPEILRYFEQYFDVPFPLPKQDMIAIPGDGCLMFGSYAQIDYGLLR